MYAVSGFIPEAKMPLDWAILTGQQEGGRH